jgi:hypothetical protein
MSPAYNSGQAALRPGIDKVSAHLSQSRLRRSHAAIPWNFSVQPSWRAPGRASSRSEEAAPGSPQAHRDSPSARREWARVPSRTPSRRTSKRRHAVIGKRRRALARRERFRVPPGAPGSPHIAARVRLAANGLESWASRSPATGGTTVPSFVQRGPPRRRSHSGRSDPTRRLRP